MYFYSTTSRSGKTDIEEAVLHGLAPDGGLFMPSEIPLLSPDFINNLTNFSFQEIALEISKHFFSPAVPLQKLKEIIDDAINFPAPLVHIHDNIYVLELFHGPTLAFKDFGARFMSRVMSFFLSKHDNQHLTILVATSGDTGSAVANGFLNNPHIDVVILYPSGKVSEIQEKQLTTMGQNITALEINGTFDDCQKLVKTAFSDDPLRQKIQLGSANSINIARLIPQIFYYFNAYKQLPTHDLNVNVSVPSGNFGNLTAGYIAQKMGLPISRLIAATNINDVVPQYLLTGDLKTHPSYRTLSNAMDVGNPSNFARMLCLSEDNIDSMRKIIWGKSYTDEETCQTISSVYKNYNYILDPHGAIGYAALSAYLSEQPSDQYGIFLETAHPAKFSDTVKSCIGVAPTMPERLAQCLSKTKQSIKMNVNYDELKEYLLSR